MKKVTIDNTSRRYVAGEDVGSYVSFETSQGRITIIEGADGVSIRLDEAMAIEPKSGNQIVVRRLP